MVKLVKRDELIDRYLSDEERRGIDQFYKDIGLGALLDNPPLYPARGPLFSSSGHQTVDCPLSRMVRSPR